MIIGRGLIGQALKEIDSPEYLFYANGVSNSIEEIDKKHLLEIEAIKELLQNIGTRKLIYFSTVQVNSSNIADRPYVQHKANIENLISSNFDNYLIVRTSNLIGNNSWNKTTLFNYLKNSLANNLPININPTVERNFLDIDHFVMMLKERLADNSSQQTIDEIVNTESYSMQEILKIMESVCNKNFNVNWVDVHFPKFEFSTKLSQSLFDKLNLSTENYLHNVFQKYCSI